MNDLRELNLAWVSRELVFPAVSTPEWAGLVERWYQLDAAAYVLSETFWQNRARLTSRPQWLLLASPQASNLTDAQFTKGPPSPAKFVHTLPNIRSASLLQVMSWSGQVLCLQNDPETLISAMSEGMHLAAEGEVWIATVETHEKGFSGHIFVLNGWSAPSALKISKMRGPARANAVSHDRELLTWLNSSERKSPAFIARGLEIIKSLD